MLQKSPPDMTLLSPAPTHPGAPHLSLGGLSKSFEDWTDHHKLTHAPQGLLVHPFLLFASLARLSRTQRTCTFT